MVTLKNFVSENAEAECPPEDTYTFELKEIGDFEERESSGFGANDPAVINTQSRFVWTLVDYDYDPEYDERDWNGFDAFTYISFYRREVGQGESENKAIFKSNRSNAYQVLTALGFDVDSGEDMDLSQKIGWRVKAQVEQKDNGWPKLSKFGKTRQKRRRNDDADTESEDSPFKRNKEDAA